MKVAVGSLNPVKIDATKLAFEKIWPDEEWVFESFDIASRVSNQPMSDVESIKGAKTRALGALKKGGADFGVGLEGGLHQIGDDWFDCGWIVVVDKKKRMGIGSTARILTPKRMMKLIHEGTELGIANDILFKRTNSRQEEGHFGLMTKNAITRTLGYRDGVIMALARFLHPDLFE